MKDPSLKSIREIVYYSPDHRPTAPTPLIAQGFVIDAEAGDEVKFTQNADTLTFQEKRKDLPPAEVTVTIPRGGYLYRMDRKFTRKRLKAEGPAPEPQE
jgi:hypothetical protein